MRGSHRAAALADLPIDDSTKVLFAASTGGHLAQLDRLSRRFPHSPDSLWVTFDSEQSRSLLDGRRMLTVPYIAPRDWRAVWRARDLVRQAVQDDDFQFALSTGSGIALAALPLARRGGARTRYVESVSRTDGPSVTGRLLALAGGVELFTQHAAWSSQRWQLEPPVLRDFETVPLSSHPASPLRIFVTLGTIRPYRFDSLVDALINAGIANEQTVWQLGCTTRPDLPGRSVSYMSQDEFSSTISTSDVVITHAGVGTILDLLERGVCPVVVPRRRAREEHVDDHQGQIARLLAGLGLGVVSEVDALTTEKIMRAALHQTTERA